MNMSIFIKVAGPRTVSGVLLGGVINLFIWVPEDSSHGSIPEFHRIPVSSNPFAKGEMNKNDSDDFGWNATGSFWGVTPML